jgi:hypothetical protein
LRGEVGGDKNVLKKGVQRIEATFCYRLGQYELPALADKIIKVVKTKNIRTS